MFNSRTLLKLLVLVCLLVATALAASPPASTNQPSPDAMKTALQPDLTLHTTFSVPLLPQEMNNPGKTTSGFCLGACGIRCTSNADCGPGGFCRPFIICETAQIEWNESVELSSHRGEVPVLNVKCK